MSQTHLIGALSGFQNALVIRGRTVTGTGRIMIGHSKFPGLTESVLSVMLPIPPMCCLPEVVGAMRE